jgi:hypothetical protein
MKLPFMPNPRWPISKEREEKVANPSSDKQLQDHLIDELLRALEHSDMAGIKDTIISLAHSFRNEEPDAM